MLDAARELFADQGYAAVSVEDVVRRAGLTRGALYHQFPTGKQELFLRVLEAVEEEIMQAVGQRVLGGEARDAAEGLRLGMQAALDASLDPGVARITLLDAPAVLGWPAWRELGDRFALGLVRSVLQAAMDEGSLAPGPVDPLAQILLAAVEEAALVVARAEDQAAARTGASDALGRLLDGLRPR